MQKYIHKGITIFKILPINQITNRVEELYNFGSQQDEENLEMMIDTLRAAEDVTGTLAVGLSAPQIGWNKRVFISADLAKATQKNILKKIDVFINPEILYYSQNKVKSEELCLSIPQKKLYIYRSDRIRISYFNMLGQKRMLEALTPDGFVYQHEMDHLEGVNLEDKASEVCEYEQET